MFSSLIIVVIGVLLVFPFDLVLEHTLLSESEAKKISKKYNTPLEKFPRILKTDKALGNIKQEIKPGQLIEIKRKDNGNTYVYYRRVAQLAED